MKNQVGLAGRDRGLTHAESIDEAVNGCCLRGHGNCSGNLKAIIFRDGIWRICHRHGLIALIASWRARTGN